MISFKQLGSMGRLGNQLFQIATTIALAERNNDKYIFPNWEYSKYFNLYDCFSDNINTSSTYLEPRFEYSPIPYKPNLNIQGFFQSDKYFIDHQDLIQQLLTPRIGFGINYDCTSIHIRRGDYLQLNQEYVQLNIDYYKRGMEITDTKNYIIFSDDIAWCKDNFKGKNIIFSEGKSPVEDLALMLSCEKNIIANSSFSWWGAYLNKNPSKIVIAPQRWFGPKLSHNIKDLLPEAWIKI